RVDVEVEVGVACDACGATGSHTGEGAITCRTCGGAGQVRRAVRSAFGQMLTTRPCPDCHGTGEALADPCPRCRGEGRRRDLRTITVEVPPGVDEGDRLRVAGAGEAGRRGAPPGDLYAEVHVRSHDVFTRDGRDLHCDVTVPLVHAALGATLEVPTLTGEVATVELPAGTQPGDVLTVKRAGLPRRGGGDPGALHVRVGVEVPRVGSQEEEELLRRFAALRGEEVPPAGRGLFRRFREAFR
ncbi:MAG TPA: DnaJ C-terminal domain-containing protein, partial [Nitriliruptorales bacterium]|nr:DnaJ C-terminal domain-containing protein [Nitriliruptorales bacterium]